MHVANDGDQPLQLFAVVDGAGADSCGAFDLDITPGTFSCSAADLGTFTGTPITRTGENNCGGTDLYNPGLGGCTGNHATGSENLYQLTLPAAATATVSMTSGGFDASLYVVSRCGDYGAATCTQGTDGSGTESLTLENKTTGSQTYYIVADSFNVFGGCGTFDLTVQ